MYTFEEIYKRLNEHHPSILFSQSHVNLIDLAFIFSGIEFQKNIIYLTNDITLLNGLSHLHDLHLIVVGETPIPVSTLEKLEGNGCSLITIPNDVPLYDVFNSIKAMFIEELTFLQQTNQLYSRLIESKQMKDILSLAEQLLENPIIIIDESFKVLDYSKQIRITDPIWLRNIENGFCSYEFISAVTTDQSILNSPLNEQPFQVTCNESHIPKQVSKLIVDKKHRGYIIILECQKLLSHNQRKLISQISRIIAHHLNANSISAYLHSEEKLILDILEKKITSQTELENRMKASNIKFHEKKYLMLITPNTLGKRKTNSTIHSKITTIFPYAKQFIYKDQLLLMISYKADTDLTQSKVGRLAAFLEESNLKGIISDFFTDINQLHSIYSNLVDAMKLGKILQKNSSLLRYGELKFQLLLSHFSNKEELIGYCHPALLILSQYDQSNETNYYETLSSYLMNNRNLQETADALYIHRNTLNNRMKRIKELTKIEAFEGEVVFQITYSFKILSYLQLVEKQGIL